MMFDVRSQEFLIMTYTDYIEAVKAHHPVIKQADLLEEDSKFRKMYAQGFFDPKVEVDLDLKSFDDKNYYQEVLAGVKLPLKFGPDLILEYENNQGDFLNPRNEVPDNGLLAGGISVPLGRGLFFDDRRKAIEESALFQSLNKVDQKILVNNIIFNASMSFANALYYLELQEVFSEAVALSEERLLGLKANFESGDGPAVDTLEAYINVISRKGDLAESKMMFNQSLNYLASFLWDENGQAIAFDKRVRPSALDLESMQSELIGISTQLEVIIASHPELLQYQIKKDFMDLEIRTNNEELKPVLNLKYMPIIDIANPNQIKVDDFKIGFEAGYNIRNRKAKAKLRLSEIKKENINYDMLNKQMLLEVKLRNKIDNQSFYLEQMALQTTAGEGSRTLLELEKTKFQIGESSVFLLNSRELKYLENRKKIVELKNKLLQNLFQLKWNAMRFD